MPSRLGNRCPRRLLREPRGFVRTNLVLDDDPVDDAFLLAGVRARRELVRMALTLLVR